MNEPLSIAHPNQNPNLNRHQIRLTLDWNDEHRTVRTLLDAPRSQVLSEPVAKCLDGQVERNRIVSMGKADQHAGAARRGERQIVKVR